jgi:hyperosmotically inducible periplasmic protein
MVAEEVLMRTTNSGFKLAGFKLGCAKLGCMIVLVTAALLEFGCATAEPQHTERTTGQTIDDASLVTRVKAALVGNPVTKARDIHVEVFRGQVQLAGFVDSASEKSEAERIAREIGGVKSVRNDLQVQPSDRSAGAVVDDSVITARVKTALIGDKRTKAFQIEVNTNRGVVQLAGFVDDAKAKYAASEVAESVSGVKGVRNDLEVKS